MKSLRCVELKSVCPFTGRQFQPCIQPFPCAHRKPYLERWQRPYTKAIWKRLWRAVQTLWYQLIWLLVASILWMWTMWSNSNLHRALWTTYTVLEGIATILSCFVPSVLFLPLCWAYGRFSLPLFFSLRTGRRGESGFGKLYAAFFVHVSERLLKKWGIVLYGVFQREQRNVAGHSWDVLLREEWIATYLC